MVARSADDTVKDVEAPAEDQHEREPEHDHDPVKYVSGEIAVFVDPIRDVGGRGVGRHWGRGLGAAHGRGPPINHG